MSDPKPESSPITFDTAIRALFRAKDRDSMIRHFDLWAYEDVVAHQDAILHAVEIGNMPCDGAWSSDAITQLRSWIAAGSPR